eukprot:3588060-Alexandrium_andersonii.AAC.1
MELGDSIGLDTAGMAGLVRRESVPPLDPSGSLHGHAGHHRLRDGCVHAEDGGLRLGCGGGYRRRRSRPRGAAAATRTYGGADGAGPVELHEVRAGRDVLGVLPPALGEARADSARAATAARWRR